MGLDAITDEEKPKKNKPPTIEQQIGGKQNDGFISEDENNIVLGISWVFPPSLMFPFIDVPIMQMLYSVISGKVRKEW